MLSRMFRPWRSERSPLGVVYTLPSSSTYAKQQPTGSRVAVAMVPPSWEQNAVSGSYAVAPKSQTRRAVCRTTPLRKLSQSKSRSNASGDEITLVMTSVEQQHSGWHGPWNSIDDMRGALS